MAPSKLHLRTCLHADHVGSLVRPTELYQKRELFEQNKCTYEEVKALEDEAIKHVVNLQRDLGLRSITDGELRRGMFFEGVFDTLEGMTVMPHRPITDFKQYIPHISFMYAAGVPDAETIFCSGKIKRSKPFYVDDFKFLKSLVTAEEVKLIKMTLPSPSWYHQRHGSDLTYDLNVYKNDDEYFDALGEAYRAEIQELYYNGCRHIQIDDPTFCYFCSESMISGMEKVGVDHEALLDTYIRAINVCTQNRPSDLVMSVHMCRGNYKGMHFSEGSYARIAKKLFNDLDVDRYYLEYDTERAGDFSPLKHLPKNKVVVLGLVTTKTAKVKESIAEVKGRIAEAVDALCQAPGGRSQEDALNQICISPQCGFASVWQGNPITEEDEINKLKLLIETAKEVWKENI